MQLRLLLADDHELIRSGLRNELADAARALRAVSDTRVRPAFMSVPKPRVIARSLARPYLPPNFGIPAANHTPPVFRISSTGLAQVDGTPSSVSSMRKSPF